MLMNRLDNQESREEIDSMGVEKALSSFVDQLKNTWNQVQKNNFPIFKPNAVIFSGMGGSGLAGRIATSLYEKKVSFPLSVYADYGLPSWVGKDSLVVANSYSGNTEETISSIAKARKAKAKILAITAGGKMAEMIKKGDFPGVIIAPTSNPPGYPKTGHGISFAALLGVLSKTKLIPLTNQEFLKALKELTKLREKWLPEAITSKNPAKQMAQKLIEKIPLLFSARPLLGSIHAATNVFHEIGRTFSVYFDFPEFNHHLVEAFVYPQDIKMKVACVFVHSDMFNNRIKLRYKVTEKLFNEQKLQVEHFYLKGSDSLTQAFEQQHFFAWVAYYLSILRNTDPGPETWIIKLKELLDQPLH